MAMRSILIVDDDISFVEEASEAFAESGYDVRTAGSGAEAEKVYKEFAPEIVLLDKKLPDIDGQELIAKLKHSAHDAQFIMVTAYGSADAVAKGYSDGFSDYILKPADLETIFRKVEFLMKSNEERLRNYAKELEAEVEERCKELTEVNRRLNAVNEKLEHFDELKSDFVAKVAHEIVNPLNIIHESLALLIDGATGDLAANTKKMLEMCQNNSERLMRFARNMLDLTKIEVGKMPMNRGRLDIVALTSDVAEFFAPDLKKNRIDLHVSKEADVPEHIWGDADLLKQLLINLVGNAVKYSPSGAPVFVTVKREGNDLRLDVRDSGPGIPKELHEKIFDKFYRVTEESRSGTGLGLPIAKEIVKLHRGTISVRSEDGDGSCFTVLLPIDLRSRSRGAGVDGGAA